MSVYMRDNGIWYVNVIIDGKRLHKSTKQTIKDKAESAAKEMIADFKAREVGGPRRLLSSAIELTWKQEWSHNDDGKQSLRHANECLRIIGDLQISKIGPPELARIHEALSKGTERRPNGTKQGTINRYNTALRRVLNAAAERGEIIAAPKFKFYPEARRLYLMSDEDYGILLVHMLASKRCVLHGADAWRITKICGDMGCRLSEAMTLEWRNVDLQNDQIHFERTKNDEPRALPMRRDIKQLFLNYPEDKRFGRVFSEAYTIDNYEAVWNYCRRLMGQEGNEYWVPHILRHRVASQLASKGHNLLEIKDWLGHKSLASVMVYAHLVKGHLKKLASSLDS